MMKKKFLDWLITINNNSSNIIGKLEMWAFNATEQTTNVERENKWLNDDEILKNLEISIKTRIFHWVFKQWNLPLLGIVIVIFWDIDKKIKYLFPIRFTIINF